jgi:hypothetical protein
MSIYIQMLRQMLRLSEVVVVSNVSRSLVHMLEMMYQITAVTIVPSATLERCHWRFISRQSTHVVQEQRRHSKQTI